MSELSTRLHLRRKELGLSQEELAQRMGYRSKSSITKLEKASTTCRSPRWKSWQPRWRPPCLSAGAGHALSAAGL